MVPSLELLRSAIADFSHELAKVTDEDWPKPTTCDRWDVTALVRHVVGGAVASNMALRGATSQESVSYFTDFPFGPDPKADCAAAAEDHLRAFGELADLSTVVEHPVMPMPASQLLLFRTADFAVHAWDLGAGLGRDVHLDPAVVEHLWNALSPMAAGLGASGMFGAGPSGTVPDGADQQTKLLDLLGRRP